MSARAEAAGKRIGVPEFEGAQEAVVRTKVMQSLKAHGFEVVRSPDLQEAMVLNGVSLESDGDLKTLAKELGLSAIVTGEVGPKRAKIVVHDGADGSTLGDASFSGANPRKLADDVELSFWKKLGPDLERGRLPAGAKRPPKAPPPAAQNAESASGAGAGTGEVAPPKRSDQSASGEEGESEESPSAQKGRKKQRFRMEEAPPEEAPPEEAGVRPGPPGDAWLDFELGGGGLNRSLTFNQNIVVQGSLLLRPYTLAFGPISVANVVLFPWTAGKVGNFGLEGGIQQGVGISSQLSSGASFSDTVHDFAAGFRYRVLFATTNDLFFSLKVGEDAFTFNGPNRSSLETPDTIYHYTRIGTGMHLTIVDGFGLSFGGGYRYINNRGGPQISQNIFPRLTVAGADADLVGRYALGKMFELRAGLEWRRYWYAAHSQAGDRVVAGGAVDQSFAVTLGLAVLLGVSSAPNGGGAEAPPPPPAPEPDARPRRNASDEGEGSAPDNDSGEPSPSVDAARARKSGGDDE